MIAHVVLFKPRATLSEEQRRAILASLTSSIEQCSGVLGCRIGRRVRHGLPGYEQVMREDYEYALVLEFDDAEGLRTYLQHPTHSTLGRFFQDAAEASLAYDYEMVPIAEAARLL